MRALVVGDPTGGVLATCRALPVVGTLAWPSTAVLRDVTDELSEMGWEAMVVDPDDLGFSTSSMSLLAQMHGTAAGVVVHCDDTSSVDEVTSVAVMALRHLPPVPVVLVGDRSDLVRERWHEPQEALELSDPIVASGDEVAQAWTAAVGSVDTGWEVEHGQV